MKKTKEVVKKTKDE